MPKMLHNHGDGRFSTIWHTGITPPDFPDRGTGFNHYDGTNWGPVSSARIEGDKRTGFPAFTVLGNGLQVSMAHHLVDDTYEIRVYSKMPADTDWSESVVPSAVPGGMVWPMHAAGGTGGNSIHLIAVTLATDFGGQIYEGLNQHLLYYRSQDGGATWDINDQIIEGCDSTYYDIIEAETYSIDANGNTIAIAVFQIWGDIILLKSTDNGETWTRTVVNDFPLDKYVINSGYTEDDIPLDILAPGTLAIGTTDGSGTVVVDHNNMVHLFYGNLYVEDSNLTNTNTEYYPNTSGLKYWNESMPENTSVLIADLQDFDGSGGIEIGDQAFGEYGGAMTSRPSAGIDDDNRLFVCYENIREDYFHEDDAQHFRHLFITSSDDNGASWSEPVDLLDNTCEFSSLIESVYPSMAKKVDEFIHFTYISDFRPGLGAWTEEDPVDEAKVVFASVDKNSFQPVATYDVGQTSGHSLTAFPNPAGERVTLQLKLTQNSQVQVELTDQLGRSVYFKDFDRQSAGLFITSVNVNDLPTGVYFVNVHFDNGTISQKIIHR